MELDELDTAWVESIIPEGAVPLAFIAVVDTPLSSTLGLLELAKLRIIDEHYADDED